MTETKPRFAPITAAAESEALNLNGKYRVYRPHFTNHAGQMFARVDEQLRLFRERHTAGKEAVKEINE